MKPLNPNIATLTASAGADEPLLRALAQETDRLIVNGTTRYSRYGLWFDTRYALWADQNDEGTKEGADAFPWLGASDTRVRLADKIIKERIRLRKAGFWGKRLQARALRGANAGAATLVNTLIKWMLYTQALPMVKRETELGWSIADTYGAAVVGCFWKRRTRLAPQSVDLESLFQLAQENEDVAKLLRTLGDPLQDEQTIAGLIEQWPDNTPGDLRRFLKQLRKTGRAEIRTAYLCKNEIDWKAMRPGIDVFFDAGLSDLQEAPLITCRELLTEADLREREQSEGWDADFIEQACQHKGVTSFDTAYDPLRMSPRGRASWAGVMTEDNDQRIEILRSFYFVHERGTSALYQTVYHRSVANTAGLHLLHGYDHGQMPFFAWRSETAERPILESRGIPELCLTWQTEEKVDRDAHTDRQSLEILPTLQVPRGLAGQVLIGPGQQLERKRAGDFEFLQMPQISAGAERAGTLRTKEICEYFGRAHPEADPGMVQLARQELVTDALTDVIPLVQQSWQLMQQYLTDEEIMAVAGPLAGGVRLGTADIRGQFTFEFTFDVRMIDTDFLDTIIKGIKEILPMDRMGVIDLSGLVGFLFHSISPDLAEQFVRPAQAAQMADVTDELAQLGGIALGIEPPLKEVSNPQLRLQVVQQTMQSPRYRQIVQADQTGTVEKLLQNQVQKYQFLLQQQQNAQTGKVGVQPVLPGHAGDGLPAAAGVGMEGGAQ